MRHALVSGGFPFEWQLFVLTDESPPADEHELRRRLKKQHFSAKGPAMFVISTAGIAEDGWTIYVNGVLDLGLMITVDDQVPPAQVDATWKHKRLKDMMAAQD